MDNAPHAADSRRLTPLRALAVLDEQAQGPEPGLDRVVRIAASVAGTEIALVAFDGGDGHVVRASVGPELAEASMRAALDAIAPPGAALVEVADAALDPRLADDPLVRGPRAIRFLAAMPVMFDGQVLGSVCVLGARPQRLADDQRAVLADLAGLVEGLLQSDRERTQLREEGARAADLATTLGESEALLSEAQRFARLGSWDIDTTTGLTAWSPSLYELFGRDRALGPISADEFRAHVVEEDRPAFEAAVDRAFREQQGSHVEFRCDLPGQSRRWIVAACEPVRDARGRVTRLRGTLQDVTDRRLSERQVRESADRHRLLWQTSTDVVMMVDGDSVIRFCNPAVERLLGWQPAELVGQPLALLQPERMRAGHLAGFTRYLATGERRLDWRAVEALALHRDGREIPVEIAFSDMQMDGQRVFGAFMRDISQRIEQRQALQRSEERYRRIVQTADEGIWMIDAASITTFVNPKMARMLGYSVPEMLGRSMYDFMDERAREEAQENVRRRASGISEPHDFRLRRHDGTDLWTAMSTSAIFDEHGAYAGALAMVTDITAQRRGEAQRRELEVQLREAQKMEAIGVLAGGIAHDFNNVLAGILGNAALAAQDLPPGHPAALSLEQISKAGLRGRGLVQQILAFARRQPRAVVSCELRPLLQDCVELLRATLPAAVTLDVALAADPLFVMADASQVQQVLMNLCTNAWHSLEGRPGRVGVSLAAVDLDPAAAHHLGGGLTPGAFARLAVEDDGRGMDAATRARIFEPFFTTKPVGEGTGLGLAVAHGIVAAHGGVIRVQTALGQGSRFEVWLPRSASTAGAAQRIQPPALAPQGRGERVLYVDDDEVMVLMVERLLARLGYVVTCSSDPLAAIEAVRARPHDFDIVVTDLNMPAVSGLEVARAIQGLRADLPVVISSGNLPDQLQAEAREAGVRALVHKQYTLEELGAVVHWVLAGGSQRPGAQLPPAPSR